MASPTYLNVTLKLMALYVGVLGAMTLFFQEAGAFVYQYTLKDQMVTRYWGAALLVLAIFYLFLSTDTEKYRLFIWVGVFDLGASMILTIVNMYIGDMNWLQGITGVIVNPIFIIILLFGLAKPPQGKVVLVSGYDAKPKPEHELPPHIIGKHPLHRK